MKKQRKIGPIGIKIYWEILAIKCSDVERLKKTEKRTGDLEGRIFKIKCLFW